LNLFLPSDVHKKTLHEIHFLAWKKGVKSLYYKRSKSIQRAESNQTTYTWDAKPAVDTNGEDCLACQ
jgi:ribonucleoside-diphosphate reductase alpha chain